MIEAVILDTGPLVAFMERGEKYHAWSVEQFKRLPPSFLTCEAVLTEVCFLLGFDPRAMDRLEQFLEESWIRVDFHFATERKRVFQLMQAYQDKPMSFADACLVRMVELHENSSILTLDRHFRWYRKYGRDAIQVIMPK